MHTVVAQAGITVQLQVREPRPCLHCGPVRCKVVPHSVVVELNLRNVAVLANAKGEVVRESLGDVVFEVAGMEVMLPVLADVGVDDRRATEQVHRRNALDRLPVLLHVITFCGKSNTRIPSSFDHLRPQDILGLEFPGVLEAGNTTLALRLPLRDLARPIVLLAFRLKCVNRRRGGARHRELVDICPALFGPLSDGLFSLAGIAVGWHRFII